MCLLDVTPHPDITFESTVRLYALPEIQISFTRWSAATTVRTSSHAYATGDNVIVHIPLSGQFRMQQSGGKALVCRPGDVYIDPTEVAGVDVFEAPHSDVMYFSIDRKLLAGRVPDLEKAFRQKRPLSGPWRLLMNYGQMLTAPGMQLTGPQIEQCASHLQDLLVMALGVRTDAPMAEGSIKAARLQALKAHIGAHLSDPLLSADKLAAHFHISARYVRSLFFSEQTSLRDYLQFERLRRAYDLLKNSRDPGLRISAVAYAVGYSDLSWFNQSFKRRYGITPSEARLGVSDERG